MRITWEETDIRGGMRCGKIGVTDETIIIGYNARCDGPNLMIVSLADGSAIEEKMSRSDVAAWLTKNGYHPSV